MIVSKLSARLSIKCSRSFVNKKECSLITAIPIESPSILLTCRTHTTHTHTKPMQAEPQIYLQFTYCKLNHKLLWKSSVGNKTFDISRCWTMLTPSISRFPNSKKSTFSVCARLQECAPVCAKVRSLCAPFFGHQTHKIFQIFH